MINMNRKHERILAAFLLFITAGAFFFCLSSEIAILTDSEHHSGYLAHMAHADELTLSTLNTASLLTTLLFLLTTVVFFSFQIKLNIFTHFALTRGERDKRRDIFHISQMAIDRWLALFALSPVTSLSA